MLRQSGIPVHDVALSRHRFSAGAMSEVRKAAQKFRPDIIQAWGHTAQIVSIAVRKGCGWNPHVIWSVADTLPLPKKAGFIDRQKLKFSVKRSVRADRIVYTSEASAAHHRRVGFPESDYEMIAPGVDAARFRPDPATRNKVRENLRLPTNAFVIGMVAPFQPEYDHATFLKGIGELIKTNPHLYVLLAGHGVQRGNAPLMAMVGGGTLGTRTQLLGEWSDLASLFNACDLVCSSALTDSARMTLATAMLCGVPIVATGMGAQGELIGQHGIAVEPGSPAAFIRGIGKILEMPQDRRMHLAHGARKHALKNFVYVRSLQKYLELYCDLVGRDAQVAEAVPAPDVEASVPIAPPAAPQPVALEDHAATIAELADPDSLETRVAPQESEPLPKWRIEQEQERAKHDAQVSAASASASGEGDVLQIFEMELAKPGVTTASPMNERARGYVEDFEELLAPEVLTALATEPSPAPSSAQAQVEPQPEIVKAAPEPPKREHPQTSTELHRPSIASEEPVAKIAVAIEAIQAQEAASEETPKSETPTMLAVPLQIADTYSGTQAIPLPATTQTDDAEATIEIQAGEAAMEVRNAQISNDASEPNEPETSMSSTTTIAEPPVRSASDACPTVESEPKQKSLFDFDPMEKKAIGE